MAKYYVNLLTRRDRRMYTTMQIEAKDINDLRKKIISRGYVEDYPRIEVISSNNRWLGVLELVDIYSSSLWSHATPYKGHYIVWLHYIGKASSYTNFSFVEPKDGRLKDTGFTYIYPDSNAKNPIIKPVR